MIYTNKANNINVISINVLFTNSGTRRRPFFPKRLFSMLRHDGDRGFVRALSPANDLPNQMPCEASFHDSSAFPFPHGISVVWVLQALDAGMHNPALVNCFLVYHPHHDDEQMVSFYPYNITLDSHYCNML